MYLLTEVPLKSVTPVTFLRSVATLANVAEKALDCRRN